MCRSILKIQRYRNILKNQILLEFLALLLVHYIHSFQKRRYSLRFLVLQNIQKIQKIQIGP